jgi:hypothetical protein
MMVMIGCGGGGSSPEGKCRDFVDTVCDRAVECAPAIGTHDNCVAQINTVIACGDAKSVGTGYASCMDHVESDSCAVLFPPDPASGEPELELPADCNGVIMVREATEDAGALRLRDIGRASQAE